MIFKSRKAIIKEYERKIDDMDLRLRCAIKAYEEEIEFRKGLVVISKSGAQKDSYQKHYDQLRHTLRELREVKNHYDYIFGRKKA